MGGKWKEKKKGKDYKTKAVSFEYCFCVRIQIVLNKKFPVSGCWSLAAGSWSEGSEHQPDTRSKEPEAVVIWKKGILEYWLGR